MENFARPLDDYISDRDLQILQSHGLSLRFQEAEQASSYQPPSSPNPQEHKSSSDDPSTLDERRSSERKTTNNTPLSIYNDKVKELAASFEGMNDDDLERQLNAAHQRLTMLENMLKVNHPYSNTMNILDDYQSQLNELHEEATKHTIGYHTPIHVARAKEKLRTQKLATNHAKRTAKLVGQLREYELTIHQQQQQLMGTTQPPPNAPVTGVSMPMPPSLQHKPPQQEPIAPLSSGSPSARAARVSGPARVPLTPTTTTILLTPPPSEMTKPAAPSSLGAAESTEMGHLKMLPTFSNRFTPAQSHGTTATITTTSASASAGTGTKTESKVPVQQQPPPPPSPPTDQHHLHNMSSIQDVLESRQPPPIPPVPPVPPVPIAEAPLPSSTQTAPILHKPTPIRHKSPPPPPAPTTDTVNRRSSLERWQSIRAVVYNKGIIEALRGKDPDHLYHPHTYKKRSSITIDYNILRDSSNELKGAVAFALAAIKDNKHVIEEEEEDDERMDKFAKDLENSKPWDITGELLNKIGIAGMINVQIAVKRWAKRSGIKRPLHFSRSLGRRLRRSSSILSPLARHALRGNGKMLSSEARAKIKMRAVRAAAAGDVTKRKKFLKSIALFQNFNEDTLDGIAKSLDYVVFIRGDVVIEQGAFGQKLYIIEKGSVDVFVKDKDYDPAQHQPTEPGLPVVGRKVMRLSAGDPFGERALMQSKPRGATCVAVENTTCFVLDRERFLQAIESIEIFDGFGYEDRDRNDVLALGRHIDKFQRMQTSFEEMRKQHQKEEAAAAAAAAAAVFGEQKRGREASKKKKINLPKNHVQKSRKSIILDSDDDSSEDEDSGPELDEADGGLEGHAHAGAPAETEEDDGSLLLQDGLLHLMSAFSPECDDNDTTERIVKTLYRLCRVERIGMFLCDWKKNQLILSIAREGGARGVRVPMKGIAGEVATSGRVINVLDAYKEPLFNNTMDKKTGFRTRTILCVPIRSHVLQESGKKDKQVLGVIQLINKKSGRVFKKRDVQLLVTVAEMLGHNLDRKHQRKQQLDAKSRHLRAFYRAGTPVSSINSKINIKIQALSNIVMKWNKKESKVGKLRVEAQLFHGGQALCDPVSTSFLTTTSHSSSSPLPRGDQEEKDEEKEMRLPEGLKLINKPGAYDYGFVDQVLELDFRVKNIPAAALLCLTVWEGKGRGKPRGWVGMRLFGYDRSMVHGQHTLKLCPYTVAVNPCSTTIDGDRVRKQVVGTVAFEFDRRLPNDVIYNDDRPVEDMDIEEGAVDLEQVEWRGGKPEERHPALLPSASPSVPSSRHRSSLDYVQFNAATAAAQLKPTMDEYNVVRSTLMQLAKKDPLYRLTREDKTLLWQFREYVMDNDTLLPKLLRSIDWGDRAMVQEGYRVMYAWEQPRPIVALTMLNDHFPDPKVRGYASLCLERMKDETLSQYILQLTQTLKHEPFHDSGLARFLLRRAIRNTRLLGHQLFWSLKAEMHDPLVSDRFGVLLDMYRRNCGAHRGELGHQLFLMRQLQNCSDIVKQAKTKEEIKIVLKERLDYVNQQLRDVDVFQLPLDPHMVSTGVVVKECRVMGSKMQPIWLVFENAMDHDQPHVVMFKAGDDLRQDQLTLQVIHVMDTLWQAEGFDFRINDYKCVSTGWLQGMLQIVQNASTVAMIVAEGAEKRTGYKGKKLARAAAKDALWNKSAISDWLLEQAAKFDPNMWNGQYGTPRAFFGGTGPKVRRSINMGSNGTTGKANTQTRRETSQSTTGFTSNGLVFNKGPSKSMSMSEIDEERAIPTLLANTNRTSSMHNIPTRSHTRSATLHTNPTASVGMLRNASPKRALTKSDRLAKANELLEHNFMMSCAGYIAATYVLGIGDRHNDNYMIRKDGCFFHIDFGHFLGNFKSKFGIKRETMPFIFTEQMKFAIGPRFNEFESLACDAYKTLRRHANLLITMFSLMVSSGMPELMTDDDIGWLRDKLMLDYAEDQASDDFKRQIEAAYKNTRVKLNDVAHLLRHVG